MDGYNDDLVMYLGIGLWVRDTAFKLKQQGIELTKRSLDYITKTSPVVYTPGIVKQTGWTMNNGHNQEDLTWLIK